jgi:hypothetical protein
MAFAGPARADARCASMVVETDETLDGLKAEVAEWVRRASARGAGIDTCARVKLRRRPSAIRVDVQLEDGRHATRTVPERKDVVPTLEALLFVPEPDSAIPEAEREPDASSGPPATPAVTSVQTASPAGSPDRARAAPRAEPPARQRLAISAATAAAGSAAPEPSRGDTDDRLGIELTVVTGARFGDGQSSVGLGALTLLDLWGWLAGIEVRADGYAITDRAAHARLELAALAGRRLRFEALALDLVAGPALAFASDSVIERTPAGARIETSPIAVPRLLARCHLNFAPRSVLRTFIGVDAELGARGPAAPNIPGAAPSLPVWMAGLALGATLGTR